MNILAPDTQEQADAYLEIVVHDSYGLFANPLEQASTIVDIGANVGIFSVLSSSIYPNADIFAYEPNPQCLDLLQDNCKGRNCMVSQTAVLDHCGQVRFSASTESLKAEVDQSGSFSVPCIAPQMVAQGRTIDLLKMDCEGAEWLILQDGSLLERSKYLRMEYHLPPDGESKIDKQDHVHKMKALIEKAGHIIEVLQPFDDFGEGTGIIWSRRANP